MGRSWIHKWVTITSKVWSLLGDFKNKTMMAYAQCGQYHIMMVHMSLTSGIRVMPLT